MSAGGWVFLILSWATVGAFVAYCFYRVFTKMGFRE